MHFSSLRAGMQILIDVRLAASMRDDSLVAGRKSLMFLRNISTGRSVRIAAITIKPIDSNGFTYGFSEAECLGSNGRPLTQAAHLLAKSYQLNRFVWLAIK